MKSKRAAGNQFQDRCEKWLLKNFSGCVVHNQKTASSFIPRLGIWTSKRQDILGCIDILAVGCDEVISKPLFIQCTLHTGIGKKEEDLLKVPWSLDHCVVEIWQGVESRRIVIRRLVKRDGVKVFVKYAEIRSGKYIKTEEDE
jgi:hypothetical protein